MRGCEYPRDCFLVIRRTCRVMPAQIIGHPLRVTILDEDDQFYALGETVTVMRADQNPYHDEHYLIASIDGNGDADLLLTTPKMTEADWQGYCRVLDKYKTDAAVEGEE